MIIIQDLVINVNITTSSGVRFWNWAFLAAGATHDSWDLCLVPGLVAGLGCRNLQGRELEHQDRSGVEQCLEGSSWVVPKIHLRKKIPCLERRLGRHADLTHDRYGT